MLKALHIALHNDDVNTKLHGFGFCYLDLCESLLAFVTPCFKPFTAMSSKGRFFTITIAEKL